MQKVEARKWNVMKEPFQAYAIDKMSMMGNLELTQQDTINLLIGGIASDPLRAMAATIRADTVENFIDDMCRMAATAGTQEKTSASSSQGQQGGRSSY